MKLWDKGTAINQKVLDFCVGEDRELDLVLVKYDIQASKAHAEMLASVGLLTKEESQLIQIELDNILKQLTNGTFQIEQEFEDMHSKLEFELTQKLGDIGKKVHSARSRNDQVLVALQLYAKDSIKQISKGIHSLFDGLMEQAKENKDILLPGFTHTQVAMPSSFGLWFSAYAECLVDDLSFLQAAFEIADQNPLGSAAGYGSSMPIDRELTSQLLGFSQLKVNSVAAQMGRGRLEFAVCTACSSIAQTVNKLASDVCLYVNQNFNFIKLQTEFTTGSSIMPHKQNPDVFELIRSVANQIMSASNTILMQTSNLSSGYHRDFQFLKGLFIQTIQNTHTILDLTNTIISSIEVNTDLANQSQYELMYTVETVNKLVLEGVPFRDAYQEVGKQVQEGSFSPEICQKHSHIGSIHEPGFQLIVDKFLVKMKTFS